MLSAIIPIANYENNASNLKKIINLCSDVAIELLFVLDIDSHSYSKQLEQILKVSKIKNYKILLSNAGNPGGTRNIGLNNLTSAWVTFWDCDDMPNPKEFQILADETQLKGKLIGVGSYMVTSFSHIELLEENILQPNFDQSMKQIALNPGIWRFIFNKEILKDIEFANLRMAEDQVFLAKILSQSPEINISDKVIYNYCVGNSSQLTYNSNSIADLVYSVELTMGILLQCKSKYKSVLNVFLARQIISALRHGNTKTKIQIISFTLKSIFSKKIFELIVGFLNFFYYSFEIKKKRLEV